MRSKRDTTNAASFQKFLDEAKAMDHKIKDIYYDDHSGEWVLQYDDGQSELFPDFNEMYYQVTINYLVFDNSK